MSGDGGPPAVPGRCPAPEGPVDAASVTLDVDGELFTIRADEFGGTDYAWLNGPDPGYGFGVSPTPDLSLDEHVANIRDFLAQVDPVTGHLEDD
ncbi:hypothetical protein O7598_17415 [Micromonospora sp. WMMC241]|uniref:hypothetical protein n=1 Tax=Micromonospora sp. WMMC241 TaxID=3015159 RepID=UPI0022B6FE56|nr:hypothetical protein [Micromonospora sp. WMMC241]MCZ7438193.1 hypothetical protein [Micromonospora sp. WMMC241]